MRSCPDTDIDPIHVHKKDEKRQRHSLLITFGYDYNS